MKKKSIYAVVIIIMILITASGCTTAQDETEILKEPLSTTESAPAIETHVAPLIIKGDRVPDEITVTTNSKPVNENSAVLIYYSLDSKKAVSYANEGGWKIIVTAFAYNIDNVPLSFSPKNINEIMDSGIPYESRSIHLYRNNIYSDRIEVSKSPSGQSIDLSKPYNYGIYYRLQ